jgi:hypothetical protein
MLSACEGSAVTGDAGPPTDRGENTLVDTGLRPDDASIRDSGTRPLRVVIDAPRVIRRGARGQFATVTPVPGASTAWTVANGTETTPRRGSALLVFDPIPSAAELRIAAEVRRDDAVGAAEVTIPVVSPTMLMTERSAVPAGTTLAVLLSLLRGQRVALRTEPQTEMNLLDFQGRLVRSGRGALDVRVPVRGSYLLHLPTHPGVELQVTGARPQTAGDDAAMEPGSTAEQPAAIAGVFDPHWAPRAGLTTGESLIRSGDNIVAAYYDYEIDRARIVALRDGAEVWSWTSPENDYVRTLAAGPGGDVYAVGSTGPAGAQDASFLVRLGPSGATRYRTVISAPGEEFAYGVSVDDRENAYVSGMSRGTVDGSAARGDLDAFVVVVNREGTPIARRSFGTAGSDRVFASCPVHDGAVLFGDSAGGLGTLDRALGAGGGVDLFLSRVDATGAVRWTRRLGSDRADLAFSCGVDSGGALYLHGMTRGSLVGASPPDVTQVYVLRASSDGDIAWARQLGPAEGQSAEAIDVGPEGVTALFYTNGSFPGGSNTSQGTRASDDAVVARYAPDGSLAWVRQFYETHERVFARGVVARGREVFVLQDHVYVPGAPFSTVTLDHFVAP